MEGEVSAWNLALIALSGQLGKPGKVVTNEINCVNRLSILFIGVLANPAAGEDHVTGPDLACDVFLYTLIEDRHGVVVWIIYPFIILFNWVVGGEGHFHRLADMRTADHLAYDLKLGNVSHCHSPES
jgi:hypothetical protein